MKSRISMVTLGVADLEISRRFYETGLSLPARDSPPGVVFFDLNGTWLGLCPRKALAQDAGITIEATGYSGVNLVHNVASDVEVDHIMRAAQKAGGRMIKAPTKADWGGYHGYFADPDGHLWEIAHNPFLWIGPVDDEV